jgi:hypothetical protein
MVPDGKFFLHENPIPAITSSSSNESSQFEARGRPIDVIVSPVLKAFQEAFLRSAGDG